ncbi:hypothetical protein SCP_1502980 [Sparassis crispa]|uniref:Uncharacterized protein n=1 Tax=Sparassis crispa TaxID=139825 RepID=A0A401H4L3_9APHY|nr:hypothetical protein SCP_1502980 [Sparassis crispa]GBE89290.1 hypothetical protein SCP_1502980 [Sparassis crispa]
MIISTARCFNAGIQFECSIRNPRRRQCRTSKTATSPRGDRLAGYSLGIRSTYSNDKKHFNGPTRDARIASGNDRWTTDVPERNDDTLQS